MASKMAYVLEWRDARDVPPIGGRSLVSHVRVFRSVSAIKAFVCARGFARHAGAELRLTLRARTGTCSVVITTVPAILAWNEQLSALPRALAHSQWEAAIGRLTAVATVEARVAAALAMAQEAGLLSKAQVQALCAALDRMLEESLADQR